MLLRERFNFFATFTTSTNPFFANSYFLHRIKILKIVHTKYWTFKKRIQPNLVLTIIVEQKSLQNTVKNT